MVRLLKRSIDNSMWKVLIKSVREYTKPSIQAPVFVALEVAIECVIPFITKREGKPGSSASWQYS